MVFLEKRVFLVPGEQQDKSFLPLDFGVSSSSVHSSSLERVFPSLVVVSRLREWRMNYTEFRIQIISKTIEISDWGGASNVDRSLLFFIRR